MAELRVYRTWGGSPNGTFEDLRRCVETVPDTGRSPLSHQCYRKRGKGEDGLYCFQHAKWHPAKDA